jgi:hypothetical protein
MSEQNDIGYILENFKQEVFQKFDNLQLQIDNLQGQVNYLNYQVTILSTRKNEIFYQKHLEKLLNGTHQKTKHGYTDITTHDAIYEIKRWNDYKSCFGQLKSYSVGNEHKRLCAAFFGDTSFSKKQEIISLFSQNNIEVYTFLENDNYKLSRLNPEIDVENNLIHQDSFEKWFDENIVYKEGSILQLKDVCYSFLNQVVPSRTKTKYKKEIEKFIKYKYPNVNNNMQHSTHNGIKYKGWIHFTLTN